MAIFPVIPGFRIEDKIGEGATACVYLGIQEKLKRKVAIKILKSSLLDSANADRFIREAEIAANLRHPNIVTIHDVGQSGNYSYIIMECLEESLKDRINNGIKLSVTEIVEVVKQVAGALEYARLKGVLHRDIKPDNILFRENNTPVIADFGLAKNLDVGSMSLTATGGILGTPLYMSPEQCRGEKGDCAGDIYSLGVVLFEMLTGSVPYYSINREELFLMHINAPAPRLPGNLKFYQPLIDGMMAKKRSLRLQRGQQVIKMIDQLTAKENSGKEVSRVPVPTPEDKAPEKKQLEKIKREIKKLVEPLLLIAIALLCVVTSFLFFLLDPFGVIRDGNVNVVKPINTNIIKETGNDTQGGIIQFEPDGGEFRDSVNVQLLITDPLKSAKGDVIDADIYYTLDGSEPTKEKGKKYFEDKPLVFSKNGTVTIRARVIARVGKYEAPVYFRVYTVQSTVEPGPIVGGEITFLKPGGNYIGSIEIPLAYKTLRFAPGKAIFGDIYYNINGDEPTRTNGTLFKEGAPVKLTREGKYTIKARVFSRDGNYEAPKVYSQTYTIQKAVPDTMTVLGGKIRFTVPSGEYRAAVRVRMEFESLRLSGRAGNIIDSEIYYTLDGSEPAKATGKRYKQGEILEFTKEGVYPVKARVISGDGKYMGMGYSQTYFIQYNVAGGAIGFTPGGGQYTSPVQVRLSIKEPIKKGNDIIEADIYYTLDGKDPGKAIGKRCTDGETIGLTKEGDYTVKARVISRDGKYEGAVYSQAYTVKPPEAEKVQTVENYNDLDKEALNDILERTQRIEISGEGVQSISKTNFSSTQTITLFISASGEVEVTNISGVKIEPAGMLGEIKARLAQAIKREKLLKPTSKGKPVNFKKKIDFVNVAQFEGKTVFNNKKTSEN